MMVESKDGPEEEYHSLALKKVGEYTLGTLKTWHTKDDVVYWIDIRYRYRNSEGVIRKNILRASKGKSLSLDMEHYSGAIFCFWIKTKGKDFSYKVRMHYRAGRNGSKKTEDILIDKTW